MTSAFPDPCETRIPADAAKDRCEPGRERARDPAGAGRTPAVTAVELTNTERGAGGRVVPRYYAPAAVQPPGTTGSG
ncbi:hypothetical protein ACE1SV_65260 [Streptomyces sennicomposti]